MLLPYMMVDKNAGQDLESSLRQILADPSFVDGFLLHPNFFDGFLLPSLGGGLRRLNHCIEAAK